MPTINVTGDGGGNANAMLNTISSTFQQSLAFMVEQANAQTAHTASVIANTVAQTISQANAQSREHDMRLMLQLQKETIEQAHKKTLEEIEETNKKKRGRTEGVQDCST